MILVTGATGHVGAELVEQLLDKGEHIRFFTRDAHRAAHLGDRVEVAVGDLDQPDTLDAALEGVDRLFLVTIDFGTRQDENAVAAVRRAGVGHIVKLSTFGAGEPTLQVDQWHHAREQVIRASGLAWTFLRPGQFASNATQWAREIKEQGTVHYPGGDGKTAPIDPRDIAAVAAVALTGPGHEGQAYQLTGPDLLTVREQVGAIARVLGRPIAYVDIPVSAASDSMRRAGMPADLVDALVEMMEAVRDGHEVERTDTVERITGRPARIFEDWCHAHIAAFQ